ncbi:Na+/H+ antiporter subunit E [Ehrlichia sp. JZT12]
MKLFFTLFTFWLTLSGYFDAFFIISGLASCIVTLIITKRLKSVIPQNNNYTHRTSIKKLLSNTFNFLYYCYWIMQQTILSNLYIIKKVWNFKTKVDFPIFRVIQTKQTTSLNVSILANSITFTPGTVSINVTESSPYKIKVLAIDRESISGVEDIDNQVLNIKKN